MKANYPTGDLSCLHQEHHRWAVSRSSQGVGQQIKGLAFTDLLTEGRRAREVKELIIQKHDPVPGGETGREGSSLVTPPQQEIHTSWGSDC